MDKIKKPFIGIKTFFQTDWNIVRARRLVRRGVRAAPRGIARYLVRKVPATQWLLDYQWLRWLPKDVLAGLTVGLVLVLQAVNLAQPLAGGFTIQQTVVASWLPGFLYALMGTSKSMYIFSRMDLLADCSWG